VSASAVCFVYLDDGHVASRNLAGLLQDPGGQ
jgi:hypothetical protein